MEIVVLKTLERFKAESSRRDNDLREACDTVTGEPRGAQIIIPVISLRTTSALMTHTVARPKIRATAHYFGDNDT